MTEKTEPSLTITDSAYYILVSLVKPLHGYAIMKHIEELTADADGNSFKLGPATLYTTLTKLLEHRLISEVDDLAQNDERRKPYLLTPKGRQILQGEIERRSRMASHGLQALEEKKNA